MLANLENSAVATGLEKVRFHSNPKEMLKVLQARLQQYMNHELPDVQAGFRNGRGTRDQIPNIHWIIDKAKVDFFSVFFCCCCCFVFLLFP